MTSEHKFKLYALGISCTFITAVFWIVASFTQSNLDIGEVILSIVNIVAVLLSIVGIEFISQRKTDETR